MLSMIDVREADQKLFVVESLRLYFLKLEKEGRRETFIALIIIILWKLESVMEVSVIERFLA